VSRPAYLGLVLLFCLTWSSAFPAAKFAIAVSPPLLFLGIRFSAAAILLLAWAGWRGELRRVPWLMLMVLGVFNQAFYQGMAWLGMRTVSSGLANIITSLNPILVTVLAVPLLGERMTWRKMIGLLLGFAGAAFVVRNRVVLVGEDPVGIVYLAIGLISVTIGTVGFKWVAPRASLFASVGAQQLGSGATLLVWGLSSERVANMAFAAPQFWLAMAWFVLVVSIGAFLLWFFLLSRGTASAAASLHFLMPPLGLAMSWAVLGEPLHAADFLGVVPIAAGIWLATRR
jgi:drug/metabolite transporter (DMT)-like permease